MEKLFGQMPKPGFGMAEQASGVRQLFIFLFPVFSRKLALHRSQTLQR
jgi:hypothetical protein